MIFSSTGNGIKAISLAADFEKAFDSIDHTFLFSVLTSYGFCPDFIQWVKTLFNNAESCVINNDHSTGYIHPNVERGKATPCQRSSSNLPWTFCYFK